MTKTSDVVAIGNAIVDVLAHTDDAFLERFDVPKGGMVLIDADKATRISEALNATDLVAGGSAGNSVACLASLGGSARFVGKVADDDLGGVYYASMESLGVKFTTKPMVEGLFTGRCLIAVTPDAERSMATFLGAAGFVSEDDIIAEEITAADVTYFEGYLFEGAEPRSAFIKACGIAKQASRKTALTLSDTGVVDRNRDALLSFIEPHVDLVFANEEEAKHLFGSDQSPEELARKMAKIAPYGAITLGAQGSIVYGPGVEPTKVGAFEPTQLVDTTGAGDAYAGGFLYGLTRDLPLQLCAQIGSLAASEVISHMGPRPEASLAELASAKGLL